MFEVRPLVSDHRTLELLSSLNSIIVLQITTQRNEL